ncbi:MAG: hypothetical protein ACSHYA_11015 [Opitutaceae bacterium]
MEVWKDSLLSGDLLAWVITILVLIVILKFFKGLGKIATFVILLAVIGVLLNIYSPGILDPVMDFVKGASGD